jgi:hypothetical protein
MNQRERTLLIVLLGLVIVVGGYGGYYFAYKVPMAQWTDRRDRAEKEAGTKSAEINQYDAEMKQILKRDPRLSQWKSISLPEAPNGKKSGDEAGKHLAHVQGDYAKYLGDLLRNSGFTPSSINVTPKEVDNKNSPQIPGKGPIYTRLNFQLQGQATLPAIVKFMRDFQGEHLLQEIHTMSITKPMGSIRTNQAPAAPAPGPGAPGGPIVAPGGPMGPGAPGGVGAPGGGGAPGGPPGAGRPGGGQGRAAEELDVTMSVEALVVSGAEAREELKSKNEVPGAPSIARKPEDYDDILKKNFFMGRTDRNDPNRVREDPNDVLRYVRLTQVANDGTAWEAWFLDVYHNKHEIACTVEKREKKPSREGERSKPTGPDLTITGAGGADILKAKIVLIEERTVVFEANNRLYKINTGDFLFPAIKTPMKNYEIREMNLTPPPDKEDKTEADKAAAPPDENGPAD